MLPFHRSQQFLSKCGLVWILISLKVAELLVQNIFTLIHIFHANFWPSTVTIKLSLMRKQFKKTTKHDKKCNDLVYSLQRPKYCIYFRLDKYVVDYSNVEMILLSTDYPTSTSSSFTYGKNCVSKFQFPIFFIDGTSILYIIFNNWISLYTFYLCSSTCLWGKQ